jgi:hypothetical protein
MLAYLRRLPSEQAVLSNAFDAIYVLTGRETYPFPRRSGDAAIPTGLTAAEEWRQTTGLMEEEGALLAAFRMATRRGHVDVSEIAEATTLCVIRAFEEGEIFAGCEQETGDSPHRNSPPGAMQGFGPRRSSSTESVCSAVDLVRPPLAPPKRGPGLRNTKPPGTDQKAEPAVLTECERAAEGEEGHALEDLISSDPALVAGNGLGGVSHSLWAEHGRVAMPDR